MAENVVFTKHHCVCVRLAICLLGVGSIGNLFAHCLSGLIQLPIVLYNTLYCLIGRLQEVPHHQRLTALGQSRWVRDGLGNWLSGLR